MIKINREKYHLLADQLNQVPFNNLFARSVIENRVSGTVFANDLVNPETFYIVHKYGMSLLFGYPYNESFNQEFKNYSLNLNNTRTHHEWMQAYPNDWNKKLLDLFKGHLITNSENVNNTGKGIIELNTRVNFKFNELKFLTGNTIHSNIDLKIHILRTNEELFEKMTGSVVPKSFWNSSKDFMENGIGYSLFYEGRLAATAFSSFLLDDKLELGIETFEEFRGKGLAQKVCAALIDFCLKNNFEPVWACRLENTGSYQLALRLGFEPFQNIPYYRLSN